MMNATCRILRPLTAAKAGEPLQREHMEVQVTELRCWLAKMTAHQEATIAGQAAVSMWECRLIVPAELRELIGEGWRLRAKLDRETIWHEYRVTRVVDHHHLALTLERVS